MIKARVVIVEDERIVALNLKQRLTKLGYDIAATATSGKQTLAEIERHRPDVILMDINIDGEIDGIETASRIPEQQMSPSSTSAPTRRTATLKSRAAPIPTASF